MIFRSNISVQNQWYQKLRRKMLPGNSNKCYKRLYIKFTWLLCLSILTLNITASIIQYFEARDGNSQEMTVNRQDIIKTFSATYNVSVSAVEQLVKNVKNAKVDGNARNKLTYMEAFVLALSLFYTIGWGNVTPVTHAGQFFGVFFALFGIPLTFMMVYTGGTIMASHVLDVIRISHTYYSAQLNKYSENKIRTTARNLLSPCMMGLLFFYILISSAILASLENVQYAHAIYYTFITLMTISFGDVTQKSVMKVDHIGVRLGLAIFMFFWLLFGMITIAATLISLLYKKQKIKETHNESFLSTKPHHLVEDTDDQEDESDGMQNTVL